MGQSKLEFHKRLYGHRSDLRIKPDLPLSRYLRSHGQSEDDFKRLTITINDHNITWSGEKKVTRESFFDTKTKYTGTQWNKLKGIIYVNLRPYHFLL